MDLLNNLNIFYIQMPFRFNFKLLELILRYLNFKSNDIIIHHNLIILSTFVEEWK